MGGVQFTFAALCHHASSECHSSVRLSCTVPLYGFCWQEVRTHIISRIWALKISLTRIWTSASVNALPSGCVDLKRTWGWHPELPMIQMCAEGPWSVYYFRINIVSVNTILPTSTGRLWVDFLLVDEFIMRLFTKLAPFDTFMDGEPNVIWTIMMKWISS